MSRCWNLRCRHTAPMTIASTRDVFMVWTQHPREDLYTVGCSFFAMACWLIKHDCGALMLNCKCNVEACKSEGLPCHRNALLQLC